MKLASLKTDPEKTIDGVWVEAGQGLRLRIARINNPRYEDEIRKILKPHLRAVRSGNMDVKTMRSLSATPLSKFVLLGWENLEDVVDGQTVQVAYSHEKAEELLKAYPEFYDMVLEYASDVALFRADDIEESKGN